MKFVIGLGNPTKEYEHTRHNVGKWIIDRLKNYRLSPNNFSTHSTDSGQASSKYTGQAIINYQLIKSDVFMNESGKFIKNLVEQHKLPLDHLLIIHDDLDIPLGEFRLQKGREAAGHKGVESVIEALGSKDFWRLRIGIGRPEENEKLTIPTKGGSASGGKNEKLIEDYVLSKFEDDELQKIEVLIPGVIEAIKKWLITNSQPKK